MDRNAMELVGQDVQGHAAATEKLTFDERLGRAMTTNDRSPFLSACRCALVALLSRREREVLIYTLRGVETKVMAHEMGIAVSTVRVLIARVAAKFNVHSRVEIVRTAAQLRLADSTDAATLDVELESRNCERMGAAVSTCAAGSPASGRKAGGVGPQECVPRCASGVNDGGIGCPHAGPAAIPSH
jgi:DNA-binding CsgD family transcriptional regulator